MNEESPPISLPTSEPSPDENDRKSARAAELVDELLGLWDNPLGACAFAMSALVSRCGLSGNQVLHVMAGIVSENLCGGTPIRLDIAKADGERPSPEQIN